jgi:hypothetical protein
MKQSMILVSLAAVLFFTNSCKKVSASSIEGVWELRQVKNMFLTNYPPGNGKKIKFEGGRYEISDNGQVTQSGVFFIVPDGTVAESTCSQIPAGKYIRRIVYNNNTTGGKIFVEITGNSLSFISGCIVLDARTETEYAKL